MKQEFDLRGRPEGDAWLVSMLLEQVCRDPVGHSPDLQHLLWPLCGAPSPLVLKPLLSGLAHEPARLATLWVCLCLWVPQAPPQDAAIAPWPPGTPSPVHSLLSAVLVAFSQLDGANDLCRTCLMTVAAIAASGKGTVAVAASELLLLLHCQGPELPPDVWIPVMPLLDSFLAEQFATAAELLSRLRRFCHGEALTPTSSGHGNGVLPVGVTQSADQPGNKMVFTAGKLSFPGVSTAPDSAMACSPIPSGASFSFGPAGALMPSGASSSQEMRW